MIRTVIFDIGNVLAGFDWYSFFRKQGFSEEKVVKVFENLRNVHVYPKNS